MKQMHHTPPAMAQDEAPRLERLNAAIGQLLRELGDRALASDVRRRSERVLLALVDRRIEIEAMANRTSS